MFVCMIGAGLLYLRTHTMCCMLNNESFDGSNKTFWWHGNVCQEPFFFSTLQIVDRHQFPDLVAIFLCTNMLSSVFKLLKALQYYLHISKQKSPPSSIIEYCFILSIISQLQFLYVASLFAKHSIDFSRTVIFWTIDFCWAHSSARVIRSTSFTSPPY